MTTVILRWDRRFRLSIGARPGPQFGRRHEPRGHGVLLDVSSCSGETLIASDPVIPRFVLPEGLARSTEQPVGGASCGSLKPAHERRNRHGRRDQNVNVVRHHHPRMKLVEQTPVLAISDRIGSKKGDSRICQPSGTGSCPIEFTISRYKSVPRPRIRYQNFLSGDGRQRSVQPPSEEQRSSFRLEVWQVSSVFWHIADGQAEAPVPPLFSVIGGENSQRKSKVVGI
jgi:hypothetical protein